MDNSKPPETGPLKTNLFESTNPWQHFFLGTAVGGFVSGILLLFSMNFSQLTLAELGLVKPAIALAIAFSCGLLTVKFKGAFFNTFMDVLSNLGT